MVDTKLLFLFFIFRYMNKKVVYPAFVVFVAAIFALGYLIVTGEPDNQDTNNVPAAKQETPTATPIVIPTTEEELETITPTPTEIPAEEKYDLSTFNTFDSSGYELVETETEDWLRFDYLEPVKYSVNFKYPSDWDYEVNGSSVSFSQNGDVVMNAPNFISLKVSKECFSDAVSNELYGDQGEFEESKPKFLGTKRMKFKEKDLASWVQRYDEGSPDSYDIHNYCVMKGNKAVEFSFYDDPIGSLDEVLMKTIVSSLEFN